MLTIGSNAAFNASYFLEAMASFGSDGVMLLLLTL